MESKKYVREQKRLIDCERDEEISRYREEIKRISGREREFLGRAVLGLNASRAGKKYHYDIIRLSRDRVIESRISAGDLVLLSKGDPLKSDITGTVTNSARHFIEVAFEDGIPKSFFKAPIRLDLYINDTPYKRMSENLERFLELEEGHYIKEIVLGKRAPKQAREFAINPFDTRLNSSQVAAVAGCLGSEELFLIHGPPGTGKSSTLCEAAKQFVKYKKSVLMCADSNIAADNLLQKLAENDSLTITRIGHMARIIEGYEEYSLAAKFEQHSAYDAIERMWDEIKALMERRGAYTKPTPGNRRGMRDEEIRENAAKGRNMRGINAKMLASMSSWLDINAKIEELFSTLRAKEQEVVETIIKESDIVIATNSMVASDAMTEAFFDVALIDEGSQQVEPSTLIPLLRCKKAVIAGDHKQLPPTVLSQKARALESTLFERLIKEHPKNSKMLEVQYRMNEQLLQFPRAMFYSDKLKSAESVEDITLKGITGEEEAPISFIESCNECFGRAKRGQRELLLQ